MIDGLDNLVARGRGTVWPVAVNADLAFAKLNLEISGYYMLSFEPESRDRDGKTHDISINVVRRGATVRARKEFSADPPNATKTPDHLLTDTLRSALSASDFGVKTTAFPYRAEPLPVRSRDSTVRSHAPERRASSSSATSCTRARGVRRRPHEWSANGGVGMRRSIW